MIIGEKIKKARTDAKMTQKELAEKCGMADSAIRKYESGKVTPKLETINKIAEALKVNVADLLGIGDKMIVSKIGMEENARLYGDEISQYQRMNLAFSYLNHEGAEKAASAVEDLAKINEYRRDEDKF